MTVYALQSDRFVDGLTAEELFDDRLFYAAIHAEESRYDEWYWDGIPLYCRDNAIRKIRRQIEDRLRKDPKALYRAFKAVYHSQLAAPRRAAAHSKADCEKSRSAFSVDDMRMKNKQKEQHRR